MVLKGRKWSQNVQYGLNWSSMIAKCGNTESPKTIEKKEEKKNIPKKEEKQEVKPIKTKKN